MNAASDDNKLIARTLAGALGGQPSVKRFWDDNHVSNVDIMTCVGTPQRELNSYCTLGLSDHKIMKGSKDYPARIELIGICESSEKSYANVLATCAFCVINDKWFAAPGVVFPNVISMYSMSSTMNHMAFFPPFLWEGKLRTLNLHTKKVTYLLAVPISENEFQFALKKSFDELEELFDSEQIDIFDINRKSVR